MFDHVYLPLNSLNWGRCQTRFACLGRRCNAPMPPAYDLIIERGGSIVVETIEACDEDAAWRAGLMLSLIHISEPTRRYAISYAVFCLKKKKR